MPFKAKTSTAIFPLHKTQRAILLNVSAHSKAMKKKKKEGKERKNNLNAMG